MNKTILITGSSSGFGKATADHFLANGWNVIATMRSPVEIFASHDNLFVEQLDVTDTESISNAIDSGIRRFGRLDAIVNNAGIGLMSAMEATPSATIREIFETNVFGVMEMTRKIIPVFRHQRSGTIINVTSNTAITPMPLVSAYAASKTAIEGFSESLAYELSNFGVKVKIVEPGYAPTTGFTSNNTDRMEGMIPEHYAQYAAQLFGNLQNQAAGYTRETDVARAVFAAATDDSNKLRYPAGADSEASAELRAANPGDSYLKIMWEAFGPK